MSRYKSFPYGPSQLVGAVLRAATMDGATLIFDTDAAPVVWDVDGDCCSESRFTDLKLDALLGKRIADVKEVESMVDPALDPASLRRFVYGAIPPGAEEAPQECEQIYGVRLTAEDGAVGFVVHRNWSNGYYGGMLSERETPEGPTS